MARKEIQFVCRFCTRRLEEKNVFPIFNDAAAADKMSLPEKLKYCFSVEIHENDGLPSQICLSCLSKLNQSFAFRNQCILAELILKRLVNDLNFDLPESLKSLHVDLENEIITSLNSLSDIFEKFNSNKNDESPKNCKEINDVLLQDDKICRNISNNALNLEKNKDALNKILKNSCLENGNLEEENCKGKHFDDIKSENLHLTNSRKLSLSNKRKSILNLKKAHVNLGVNIKNATECDSLEINIKGKEKTENETAEINVTKCQEKSIQKFVKSKSSRIKRDRSRKLEKIKKKPSSYTCHYCQKVYSSEGGWRYHIYTLHNEKYEPFICDLCGQSFKVKKNLEGHKNSIHFHLKLHLCDLCGRGFASRYALKVHKTWHNDEKDFACDVCGTKFRTRGKLNTHKSVHGGPKNFMCHICSRNFRWKKDFEVHVRTHTGEKPFGCSHCPKTFASFTNMKKHERNHSDKSEKKKFRCLETGKKSEVGKIN